LSYNHLFFDLDRTLWDLDKNVYETLLELIDLYNLEEKGVPGITEFHDSYNLHNNALWSAWEKGETTRDKIRRERFIKILGDFNIDDEKLALKIAADFLSISPYKTNLVDGAKELLDHAVGAGVKLAIITNGFEDVQHVKMRSSGLDKYFKTVITSESAGIQKPNPEIFYHALKVTGASLTRSLMIGDSLSADIQGAMNAGMPHVYYNPTAEIHDMKIDHEIRDLREIRAILSS
jgi:putative hydrolase of the HAD superfamily